MTLFINASAPILTGAQDILCLAEQLRDGIPILGERQEHRSTAVFDDQKTCSFHRLYPRRGAGVAGDVPVEVGLHASRVLRDVQEDVDAVARAEDPADLGRCFRVDSSSSL